MRTLHLAAVLLVAGSASLAQQPNTAAASLVVNGTGASATGPFTVNIVPPQTVNLLFGGTSLQPFVLFNANPGLGGAIVSPGAPAPFGIVDIGPLAFPPIEIVLDGVSNAGTVLGSIATIGTAGSTTIAVTIGGAIPCGVVLANLQAAVINPSNPAGFQLSAATRLQTLLTAIDPAPVPISMGDDVTNTASFAACGSFTFYGVTYNSYWVNSNGNISFGAGSTLLGESISGFHTGPARVCAAWDDLNPGVGGSLTKFDNGTSVVVQWTNVPEYATSNSNTLGITLDLVNRTIVVSFGAMSLTDCLTGIGPGLSLATTQTVFGPGSTVGRMADRIGTGTLGSYAGGVMESMAELFVTTATTTAAPFNLATQTLTFQPLNPTATSYGLY